MIYNILSFFLILASIALLVCGVKCVTQYTGLSSYKQDLYLGSFLLMVIIFNLISSVSLFYFLYIPMLSFLSMELLNYSLYYTTIIDNKWVSNFFKGFGYVFMILCICLNTTFTIFATILFYMLFSIIYGLMSRLNKKVFTMVELSFLSELVLIISFSLDKFSTSSYINIIFLIVFNILSIVLFAIRQKDYHSIVYNLDKA